MEIILTLSMGFIERPNNHLERSFDMIEDWREFREGMILKELDPIMKDWKLLHVGIIVEDLDRAVSFWLSTGIATFDNKSFHFDINTCPELSYYGKPADPNFDTRWRLGQIGAIPVELGQVISGESTYKEFFQNKGEGVHHIGFSAPNFDEAAAYMVSKGMPMLISACPKGCGWAYFDAQKTGGGVIIELIDFNSKGCDWYARLTD